MIRIESLDFAYDNENHIFQDFSIEINNGIHGMIGINGAGKSTLLKIILGFLNPASGKITVGGIDSRQEHLEFLRHIGVVLESTEFPPWMVVADQLIYVAQLRGMNRHQAIQEVDRLLEKFELGTKKQSKVKSLSAGLKQRFVLIQACIGTPEYLFLDEPTANLDAQSRITILKFLKKIARERNTNILMFSHILSDLEKFCDHYSILHQGKIVDQNSIKALISNNSYREYIFRFPVEYNRDRIKTQIVKYGTISEENEFEILYEVDPDKVTEFKALQFDSSVSVTNVRSLLEQVFLEKTGVENL